VSARPGADGAAVHTVTAQLPSEEGRTVARARKPAARKSSGTSRTTRARRTDGASRRAHGTDAISVLRHQHDETRKLFQELAEAEGDERRQLFARLADALEAHARVEERFLYPELARADGMADMARDAEEEHLIVKRLLADLLEKRLDPAVFDAKCRVLEVETTRHLEEEESVLLPKARRLIARDRLEEMGSEIQRMFEELMQHEPRREVAREIDAAPPLS
jgi:hemerythrin-like domain-containing protein